MPGYGKATPTLTSCACAQEVVRASAARAAVIIHLAIRVPPRRARMGRILWQKPETAQVSGRRRPLASCATMRLLGGAHNHVRRTTVAKFKVVTPSGASSTVPGGGYKLEMEALAPLDAEIVEIAAKSDDDFVKQARDADALYAKGRRITKRIIDGLERCRVIALGSVGVEPVTLTELLQRSDIVSMHAPATDAAHHLLTEHHFRLMKPEALFISTGRGPTTDEAALIKALKEGWIAAAGLDVFEQEPVDPN